MRKKLHRHDLSCEKDFSANMGYLIPTNFRMCYPGDIVRERDNFFVRVSPLLAPIISKVMIKAETFFVPHDIIWDNAQAFYSGGQDGTNASVIPVKTITASTGIGEGTLANYLGYKPSNTLSQSFNILPIRAYQAIWNWHYRDLDLQTARVVSTADGPDTTTNITLAQRCWERDRFTTMRLEPQRGDDVLIPGSTSADFGTPPVLGIGAVNQNTPYSAVTAYESDDTTSVYTHAKMIQNSASSDNAMYVEMDADTNGYPNIRADLTDIDATTAMGTIRELGEAVAIDRFRRRLQTADGSYPDYTLATFGIRSPDMELQKPVLLARSSSPLQISEVVQTSPDMDAGDSETFGVGNLYGHGIATATGHGYKYHVKKHGYIMTIFSVVPKSMYVQGNDKEWFRSTKEDYFDPDLDQIGEEAVYGRELNMNQTTSGNLDEVVGYQYRYYADRSALNSTAGEMDSTLNMWHQARDFGTSDVQLNSDFVTCNPTDRIFALGSTQDQLRVKAMHDIKMLRTMRRIPMRGVL